MSNERLAEELHKPIITKFKKKSLKDNIWSAYLADMELISKFNKGFRFLLIYLGCSFKRFKSYNYCQYISKYFKRI